MADDSTPTNNSDDAATAAPAPVGQAKPQEVQIAITAQYIKDLSFEVPGAPDILAKIASGPPQVKFNMDVRTNRIGAPDSENEAVEVALSLGVESAIDGEAVFIAEMQYCGICPIAKIPPQARRYVLLVEIPRLLFPFARATISNVIIDSGFPPVMIQPIDFVAQYRMRMQKEAAAQTERQAERQAEGQANGSNPTGEGNPPA